MRAAEAASGATASNAAHPDSAIPAVTASALPASLQPLPSTPTLTYFHDSNFKATAEELDKTIKQINKKNNNNQTNYNINLQPTYTLPQTLEKIRHMTFNKNDKVIIGTLTNDARQTKHRRQKTTDETGRLQTKILTYLLTKLPPQNITFLEAPPILTSDIFPYNAATHRLAHHSGARFAETLVGEGHIFRDGYHILNRCRHLLLKSVAAAATSVNPRSQFGLNRPPHGPFGPWVAPAGRGMLPDPSPADFRVVASARPNPIRFRPSPAHFPPLNNRNIQ